MNAVSVYIRLHVSGSVLHVKVNYISRDVLIMFRYNIALWKSVSFMVYRNRYVL